MPHTMSLVTQMVNTLQSLHEPEVVDIVTAHLFATTLMDHFGRNNKTSLEPCIHLLDRMVLEYAKLRGHDLKAMLEARWDIVSAGRKAESLLNENQRQTKTWPSPEGLKQKAA